MSELPEKVLSFIHTVLQSQSLVILQSCYVLQHKRALLQSNGLECMAVLLSASGPGPLAKVLHPRHLGRCPFWHQHQKLCFDINIKSWDKSSELWIHPNYPRTQVSKCNKCRTNASKSFQQLHKKCLTIAAMPWQIRCVCYLKACKRGEFPTIDRKIGRFAAPCCAALHITYPVHYTRY